LVAVNNPDKIIFVGEALVGNEAVDQLTKFDRALRDFSSASSVGSMGKGRGIDGLLVTKWDTVDDKVRNSEHFFRVLVTSLFHRFFLPDHWRYLQFHHVGIFPLFQDGY
jgi:hypothetical protein